MAQLLLCSPTPGWDICSYFLSSTERYLYKSSGCNEEYLQRKKGQISDKCPGMEGDRHRVLGTKIGDKISRDTIALKGLSDISLTSKGENKALPPPSPPYNVVPLFELPIENNKHLNLEWRGGVWILLFSEVTLFEYNVSTILSPIVAFN